MPASHSASHKAFLLLRGMLPAAALTTSPHQKQVGAQQEQVIMITVKWIVTISVLAASIASDITDTCNK